MAIRLLVIVGPNAVGKTRLGIRVAHALGSEIVSADSRQVYRGLDIGSGKDLEDYDQVSPPVPYHLIDVADPGTIYALFTTSGTATGCSNAKPASPRMRTVCRW